MTLDTALSYRWNSLQSDKHWLQGNLQLIWQISRWSGSMLIHVHHSQQQQPIVILPDGVIVLAMYRMHYRKSLLLPCSWKYKQVISVCESSDNVNMLSVWHIIWSMCKVFLDVFSLFCVYLGCWLIILYNPHILCQMPDLWFYAYCYLKLFRVTVLWFVLPRERRTACSIIVLVSLRLTQLVLISVYIMFTCSVSYWRISPMLRFDLYDYICCCWGLHIQTSHFKS